MIADQIIALSTDSFVVATAIGVIVIELLAWRTRRRTLTVTGYRALWMMLHAIVNDLRPSTRRDLAAEAAASREDAALAALAALSARTRRQTDIEIAIGAFERDGTHTTALGLAETTGHPVDECAEGLAAHQALLAEMRRWRT